MKKILLPVLMIATMVLFVSCGSAGYRQGSAILEKTMKQIKAAKTCEELETAIEVFDDWDYPEDITDMEEEKLDQLCDQIEELYDQKEDELCDDDWY